MQEPSSLSQDGIAIIGMAGRFPGARDIDQFWRNLAGGIESIARPTDAQLLAAGVDADDLRNPAYVKAAAILDDIDLFDAAFFGFSPKDAAIMDPQHRLFLECAWHALEHAGWAIEQFDGRIAVYAGSGMNTYLIHNLLANRKLVSEAGLFVLKQTGNDKDVLATRVSYQLNLTGPSLAVQTACSTSLVAVHLASQSLLSGECDMALAGGVTIEIPHGRGYLYREGEILSRDGHCRPFDAESSGTIFGSGLGVVVLRRLEDALRDGDSITAIIRGTAINNDGSRKVGFLAPSVPGQAEVIAEAMGAAGVDADSISYIEAHGTGTTVGDPIELEALTRAFRRTSRRGVCAVESLKANVGHLDAAAGVAGLIKTALALKNRQIPPAPNWKQPNPLINFAESPFFVPTTLREWKPAAGVRRAGVTSLGIGGTNAHVVLEEAPPPIAASPPRNCELLTFSAKTPAALETMSRNLADYLDSGESASLSDVVFTCHLGRAALPYRRAVVCRGGREAAAAIRQADEAAVITRMASESRQAVVFMFPGQGAQYPGMARGLFESEPEFRSTVEYCCEFLRPHLGIDLLGAIFPAAEAEPAAAALLAQTRITQPALFVIEYALARLWTSLGIVPSAMIGHSVGEFAAACIAGVFSLDDTLRIVAERGRLMQSLPAGVMTAVAAAESEVAPLLDDRCSLASVNAQDECVVAGPADAVEELEAEFKRRQLHSRRLHVSHAFHSPMMDPIVEPFANFIGGFEAQPPSLRWVSSTTGNWIAAAEASQPAYWARQLRGTVRFYEGASALLKADAALFLEAGPGRTLSSLIAQHPERPAAVQTINTLAGARDHTPADASFLRALGVLWASGCPVDWRRYHRGEQRHRVALPGYPFERRRFWIDPDPSAPVASIPDSSTTELAAAEGIGLFRPVWKEAELPGSDGPASSPTGPWLIFADAQGLGDCTAAILRDRGEKVTIVRAGEAFTRQGKDEIQIAPARRADYDQLASALRVDGSLPRRILHLWSVGDLSPAHTGLDDLKEAEAASFWSVLFFAQAFAAELEATSGVRFAACSNGLEAPEEERSDRPEQALLAGPCGVISKELPDLQCLRIDLLMPSVAAASNGRRDRALGEVARPIITELDANDRDPLVAYRRGRRFVRRYEPLARKRSQVRLRDGAVHVITGGLGGIGLALADAIADSSAKARLVLLSRNGLPAREEWPRLIEAGGALAITLGKIESIERNGTRVMAVAADVTDEAAMVSALAAIHRHFGPVTGVIHTAGTIADAPLLTKSFDDAAAVLAPKVRGTLVVERVFASEPLEYLMLCSSVSSVLAPAGQVDYAAANAFLDAFARTRSGDRSYPVIALQFPRWTDAGMAADRERVLDEPSLEPEGFKIGGASDDEAAFDITLSLADDWVVREHRTRGGVGVFPGTGYIEMILKAAQELIPPEQISIHDLQFKLPLEVASGETRRLRMSLRRNGSDHQFAALVQTRTGWSECASARVVQDRGGGTTAYDLAELRGRCALRELTFAHRQNRIQESFFDFGPRWRTLSRIAFGDGEALADLELSPEFHSDLGDHQIHPALLDMATGAALFLVPNYESLNRAYVPMGYGRISVKKPLPARCHSYLRIRPDTVEDSLVAIFDADILDDEGNVLIEIREFMMRQIRDGLSLDAQRTSARATVIANSGSGKQTGESRDSISSLEGIAAFQRVLDGAYSANVVVFPSDFAALERARPLRAVLAASGKPDSAEAMRDEVERTVAEWWRELLGAESLTPQSDFFHMGGQSLTAMRLSAKIKKTYGVQLSSATIFEAPTIEKLAHRIREGVTPTIGEYPSSIETPGLNPSIHPNSPSNSPSNSRSGALIELRSGGPRSLFFVHDGDGETLLYLNFARRMPEDLAVFAIEPRRIAGVPLAHTTIEDMAAFYVERVRSKQPHGPYLFAGLCAGGTIAYEMAWQLVNAGERVEFLALLESALPRTAERPGRFADQRRARLKQAIADARKSEPAPLKRAFAVTRAIRQKLTGALLWKVSERGNQWWVGARFRLLREVLRRDLAWPRLVQELNVSQIYYSAQARYTPKPLSIPAIVLVRARTGEGADTPYRDIYADKTFGWSIVAPGVTCVDVDGGHSTMLQEHFVDSVAKALLPYLQSKRPANPQAPARDDVTAAGLATQP